LGLDLGEAVLFWFCYDAQVRVTT